MQQSLGLISLVVHSYEDALEFYVGKLGFELVEDTSLPAHEKRWIVVRPHGQTGACLLLARASSEQQRAVVGRQTGDRVFLFLYTDNFWCDYRRYKTAGVQFIRNPEEQPQGLVAVFEDLYGNKWDLMQPSPTNKSWHTT